MGKRKAPLISLVTGGTGGHVFPAQALAEEMVRRDWRVEVFIDRRGQEFTSGMPQVVRLRNVPSATFARGGLPGRILVPFRIMAGVLVSLIHLVADRPAVQVGFGGYMTFPPMLAGWMLRIPGMLHEQNAEMGLANRMLARLTRRVATNNDGMVIPAGVVTVRTGNPVRREILARADSEYRAPDRRRNGILVIGGSQGASLFDLLIPTVLHHAREEAPGTLFIQQQVTARLIPDLEKMYDAMGVEHDLRPFYKDIADRLASSQLVIARAGASTLAELSCIGRPAILVPFARSANNHQVANARAFERAGAAICIEEHQLTVELLAAGLLSVISKPDRARAMARASKSLHIRDAADALANAAVSASRYGA